VSVFALTLVCCYVLLRRWRQRDGYPLGPAICVVLLAVSPFCFAFTRLAIVEPLLVLLMVMALLAASSAGRAAAQAAESKGRAAVVWVVVLGLLFPAMVLTKTTALFLFPAVMWMLWAATGFRVRAFLRVAVPAAGVGVVAWGAYFELLVRPRYLADYRYLFDANTYTGFKLDSLGSLLYKTMLGGVWLGGALFALALVGMIGTLVGLVAKGPRASPVQMTMLLWVLGYGAFLAYHANLQPRYYLVVAVPVTVLAAMGLEPLFLAAARTWSRRSSEIRVGAVDVFLVRLAAGVAGGVMVFAAISGARQTVGFVRRPEYSWVSAAEQIRQAVEREAAESQARSGVEHSKLVLSISGSNLSLTAGLRSICDDFGTMSLPARVVAYKPGWYAAWNEIEDDKMEALAPLYRLERVMAVRAFDDPDRNLLILYRLDALASPGAMPGVTHRRSSSERTSVRTKIGPPPSLP
jgi:hypothetical protein